MEQKALIFEKQCTNKTGFPKTKKPIRIDNVEIRRILLSKKDSHLKKNNLNILLNL